MQLDARRLLHLMSRTLCLAAVPVVVFAFWDSYFSPLCIKELLAQTMGLLAFLLWWVAGRGSRDREGAKRLPNPLAIPLWLLCAWALISIAWTGPKQLAFQHWTTLAGIFLFLPPLFDYGRSPLFRRAYRNVLLAVGVCLLVLAAFQLNGISLGDLLRVGGGNTRTRVSLTIGHNNGVAPIVLLTSFLALGAMAGTRTRMLRISLLLTCLACWALIVFFLLTRSTYLGLFFGLLLLTLLNGFHMYSCRERASHGRSRRWMATLLSVCTAFAIAVASGSAYLAIRGGSIEGAYNPNLARNITDRMRTLNVQYLKVDTRARLWMIGLHMMRHHPLLGLGFSSAKYDYPFYQAVFFEAHPDFPSGPTSNHTERLHNDYLQWFAECGAVGMLLLLWCLLVFGKTILNWLCVARRVSAGAWFAQSATLVACMAVLMDACFSFPAHIAPIAIYLPGLMMLWFGQVFRPAPSRRSPRFATPISLPFRALLAAAAWAVLILPLGADREKQPWLTRSGLWVPVDSQVRGRYWQGRMAAARGEFEDFVVDAAERFSSPGIPPADEIGFTLNTIRKVRERFLEYPPIIPFAGEAIFAAGRCFDTLHQLYTSPGVGPVLAEAARRYKGDRELLDLIRQERSQVSEFLDRAEDFFEQSLRNYRYHALFRRLGLVRLKMVGGQNRPELSRPELIGLARKDLETARRIFFSDDGLFLELDIAMRVNDTTSASLLVDELLERAPGFLLDKGIETIAEKGIRRDPNTGRKILDETIQDFFRLLLPRLDDRHADLFRGVVTLLDGGNADALARDYALRGKHFLPLQDTTFLDYRMLDQRASLADIREEIEEFQSSEAGKSAMSPEQRILYLSDLQRFSLPETDMTQWREEVEALREYRDWIFPIAVGWNCVAQESFQECEFLTATRDLLRADGLTSLSNQERVADRRSVTLRSGLWGIGFPMVFD